MCTVQYVTIERVVIYNYIAHGAIQPTSQPPELPPAVSSQTFVNPGWIWDALGMLIRYGLPIVLAAMAN